MAVVRRFCSLDRDRVLGVREEDPSATATATRSACAATAAATSATATAAASTAAAATTAATGSARANGGRDFREAHTRRAERAAADR